jgi:hypothetical protein
LSVVLSPHKYISAVRIEFDGTHGSVSAEHVSEYAAADASKAFENT